MNIPDSDYITNMDSELLVVVSDKAEIVAGESDVYITIDKKVCISISGDYLKEFITKLLTIPNLTAIEADALKRAEEMKGVDLTVLLKEQRGHYEKN